ncbi:uncharacterized protein LOC129972416 [Argiope bruennichi]|uniref:uncharacterized protein LOC129972416 n=1 Tax=Argiope bruennichi TaxID=94029 RepID=UPI00249531E8|nr:uncharacterized protein LOC129972416 [Argiope bruennichi]
MSEDINEDDIEKESRSADEYSLNFKRMSLLVDRKTNPTVNADTLSSVGGEKRKFKLPRLELKKFGGEIKDWLPFWGQFVKIDEDNDIDETDKFQYLVQATIPNSRARELVESFPPTSGNYCKAIDCLKSRFGRDDLLVEYYVRELLKLTLAFNLKEKHVELSTVYDRLETQLRSLETLGVTTAKYAAMLFPLVESCLSEEVLRAWRRNDRGLDEKDDTKESRLESLMKFLKNEVENEDRIALAMEGFSLKENNKNIKIKRDLPTAAGLFSGNQKSVLKCAFCDKNNHESKECHVARNLDLSEKMNRLKKRGCCFRCLSNGHVSKLCRVQVNCGICGQRHHAVMCPDRKTVESSNSQEATESSINFGQFNTLTNPTCSTSVFLQTLVVVLRGETQDFAVRALIDTGSQKSYITKEAAKKMKYPALKETTLIHTLFGGMQNPHKHSEYKIFVSDFNKNYHCTFNAFDQEKICAEICQIPTGFWSKELEDNGIHLTDQECLPSCSSSTIHLLIGADIAGKLMTGKILNLTCGLTATETLLGWTLMGRAPSSSDSISMTVTNLLIKDFNISDLCKLEAIGITDPTESKKKTEMHQGTSDYFRNTLTIDEEGRYKVALPWVLESSWLPDNRQMAEKQLSSVYKKLVESEKVGLYADVFKKRIADDVIEESENKKELNAYYLPHRLVFKENSITTKVKPVFDASAYIKGTPSLNAYLESGPNLIELVPSLLNRLRKFPAGIASDIEKAFLQIGIRERYKDYLRFLWKTKDKEMKIYRHRRVVFGVTCSPSLLAATLNCHLEKAPEELLDTAEILKNSFYVDNCVCSLKNIDEADKFIAESQALMSLGKFNLRGWESNASLEIIDQPDKYQTVSLLGLNWDLKQDTLSCIINCPKNENLVLTKRDLLSLAQSIFDPLGISSPVTIIPKFMLQESWNLGLKWDDALPEGLSKLFWNWLKSIKNLSEVKIPRWMKLSQNEEGKKKENIWKFIPPSAPWWGGWWERLIALVKYLLKKVLSRACLSYEELNVILCYCEDIVNSRPITYVSEHHDLEPITPFLRKRRENGIPDLDHLELSPEYFCKWRLYRCKLQEDLRNRFRLEYLWQLRQQTKKMIKTHDYKVGEVVIVEVTNQKRLNWPLGKITEIFPGKDGSVRLVKVKTKKGEFLRPVQRLYALEVQTPSVENLLEKRASGVEDEKEEAVQQQYVEHPELPESDETSLSNLNTMKTRFGRKIQVPNWLDL